jgi:hypothetical protein
MMMGYKSMDIKSIVDAHALYTQALDKTVNREVVRCITAWSKRYPKRLISLISGMGGFVISIDGISLEYDEHTKTVEFEGLYFYHLSRNIEKNQILFKELIELYQNIDTLASEFEYYQAICLINDFNPKFPKLSKKR